MDWLPNRKKLHFFTAHESSCVQEDMVVFLGNGGGHEGLNLHEGMIFALFEHSTSIPECFTSTFRKVNEKCMKFVGNLQVKLWGYFRIYFPSSERQNF